MGSGVRLLGSQVSSAGLRCLQATADDAPALEAPYRRGLRPYAGSASRWLLRSLTGIERQRCGAPLTCERGRTLAYMEPYTPVELARLLGYRDEARPGLVVRRYLRATYPNHVKNSRWELTEEQPRTSSLASLATADDP